MSSLASIVSCMDDYDPEALPVETARRVIRSLVTPVTANERVAVRAGLGRVLGADVVSTMNVPAHDNSAMDGYAVRGADLKADDDTVLQEIGTAFAGRPLGGAVGPGQCVRVMTGAVMPAGADTVVIQEVVRAEGDRVVVPPGQKAGQNRRRAGEDLAVGPRRHPGWTNPAPGRPRAPRLARARRGDGAAPAARRVLLDRRRAGVGRRAAQGRRGLRLQPLHALWNARPSRGAT